MIKVEILENIRYFEAEDADFYINFKHGPKELPIKALKAMSIKHHLLKGLLKVVEGEFTLDIKHATILFSAEYYPFAYGIEFGKFFRKDLQLDTIEWYPFKDGTELDEKIKSKIIGEKDETIEIEKDYKVGEKESNKERPTDEEEPVSDFDKKTPTEEESFISTNEEDEKTNENEEVKRFTEEELYNLNKEEQCKLFTEVHGFKKKEIPKYEDDRVKKLLELQG